MKINVAYACNDAYMIHTGISLISLCENNKDIEQIAVYFIDMGISEKSRLELENIVKKYNRELMIIPFSDWEADLPVDFTGRHIKSVYAKIFFGRIKGIDRILYLDSDTVIVDSIRGLWDTDMGACAIAGVQTVNTAAAKNKIGLTVDDLAINDGIVLMNLKLWRNYLVEEKCIAFIRKWKGNPPVLSEGTINAVCKGYIYRLGLRYNLTSASKDYSSKEIEKMTGSGYYMQAEVDSAAGNPCIIHYVSGFHDRPWNQGSTHPFKEEYLKYRKISKWKSEPLGKSQISARTRVTAKLFHILPMWIFQFFYKLFGRSNHV